MSAITTTAERRVAERLAAWARTGRRADLPHLAVELGLPRLADVRYQTHAAREGWWAELALAPHDDDTAWQALARWAAAAGTTPAVTLPHESREYGLVCEMFTQIHRPGPGYGTEVGIWTHVAPDWTGPGRSPRAAAAPPAAGCGGLEDLGLDVDAAIRSGASV